MAHNIHQNLRSKLQIVPDISDEVTEIKMRQEGTANAMAMSADPTGARMKIPKGAHVTPLVERIGAKQQQETDANTNALLNRAPVTINTTMTHTIKSVPFEGTEIRTGGYGDTVESAGLKTGSAFQVEYMNVQTKPQCCVIA
jgi:hypothetical protein